MHIVYIVHCNRGGSGVREAGAGGGGRKLKKKLAGRQVVVVRECRKKGKKRSPRACNPSYKERYML